MVALAKVVANCAARLSDFGTFSVLGVRGGDECSAPVSHTLLTGLDMPAGGWVRSRYPDQQCWVRVQACCDRDNGRTSRENDQS
eukprot:m.89474 g.89474  ORF g.89474 m.89474 type:complete len:84 (+) comp20060_c0_seq1:430-681(+)